MPNLVIERLVHHKRELEQEIENYKHEELRSIWTDKKDRERKVIVRFIDDFLNLKTMQTKRSNGSQ